MNPKELLKEVVPPILLRGFRHVADIISRNESEYTYCPEGWPSDTPVGWNSQSAVEAYLSSWSDFRNRVQDRVPWDLKDSNSQASMNDVSVQNMRLVFAYAYLRAAYGYPELKVLDWGGGIGHYYVLAHNILPELVLDWTIKDLPLLCAAGERLLPTVRFTSRDDEAFAEQYQFVLASSSLQYAEDWRTTAKNLARATKKWLLITRHPLCHRKGNYVLVQRSYGTVYPGWVFNRREFLTYMETECGLSLVREFLISPGNKVTAVPEQTEARGFLFSKTVTP